MWSGCASHWAPDGAEFLPKLVGSPNANHSLEAEQRTLLNPFSRLSIGPELLALSVISFLNWSTASKLNHLGDPTTTHHIHIYPSFFNNLPKQGGFFGVGPVGALL